MHSLEWGRHCILQSYLWLRVFTTTDHIRHTTQKSSTKNHTSDTQHPYHCIRKCNCSSLKPLYFPTQSFHQLQLLVIANPVQFTFKIINLLRTSSQIGTATSLTHACSFCVNFWGVGGCSRCHIIVAFYSNEKPLFHQSITNCSD